MKDYPIFAMHVDYWDMVEECEEVDGEVLVDLQFGDWMRAHKGQENRKDGVMPQLIAHDDGSKKLDWRMERYKEGREEEATSPDKSLSIDGEIDKGKDRAQRVSNATPESLKKKAKKGAGNQRVTYQKRNGLSVVNMKSMKSRATKRKTTQYFGGGFRYGSRT